MNTNTTFEAKDATRIADILRKAKGSDSKAEQLATNMAEAITKAEKALRRCRAAEDVNEHGLAKIFYRRYQVLTGKSGSYAKLEQLAAQAPLPIPEPEMEIKIKSIKFVPKEALSARPCVYFWNAGTSNLGEMFMQRYTPRTVFLPHLDEVLEPIGMTATLHTSNLRKVKASWSQYAGCKSCPCSPGFVLSDETGDVRTYRFDIHVDYVVQTKSVRKAS